QRLHPGTHDERAQIMAHDIHESHRQRSLFLAALVFGSVLHRRSPSLQPRESARGSRNRHFNFTSLLDYSMPGARCAMRCAMRGARCAMRHFHSVVAASTEPPMTAPPDWYKTFFAGPAVEFWLASTSDEESAREVELLERALALPPCARVLDVPSGGGRH